MRPSTRRLAALATLLGFAWAGTGWGALRVEAEGTPPVVLPEAAREGATTWYDAETWLRQLPGTVEWSAEDRRLTYREGGHWAALRPDPPYALRDGRPLEGVDPPRLEGDRLWISGRFLRTAASALLGRRVRVASEGPERVVVIDPGHGGDAAGSAGAQGTVEKEAVLALARTVAERLRAAGFQVYLTRTDDRALGAAQRAGVANYRQADLFLSLHAAGEGRPQARGFELFLAPDPPAATDGRLWAGGQVGRTAASLRWAEALRAALGAALPSFDRGLKRIPTPLLEAVAAPACLLEAGSLSWSPEAELFFTDVGRATVADAVVRAAEDYFAAAPNRSEPPGN